MLAALLLSFAVIFVAELGDKTQLVAMMFALRYRWWVVLSAITAATAVVHVLSVAIGYYLGAALPTHLLGFIAGAMFIFFGLWTLRGDSLTDEETSRAAKATAPANVRAAATSVHARAARAPTSVAQATRRSARRARPNPRWRCRPTRRSASERCCCARSSRRR